MTRPKSHSVAWLLVPPLAVAAWILTVRAQQGCVNPPTDTTLHWAQGQTVYYMLDSSIATDDIKTPVWNAITAMNNAASQNGSGITFAPADADYGPNVGFSTTADASNQHPAGWVERPITDSRGNIIGPVQIYFNLGAMGTDLGGTLYNDYDLAAPGYDTIFEKETEHELSHSLGLNDVPMDVTQPCGGQTPGGSVMNGPCGSNDSYGNMPVSLTPCDNNVVNNSVYNPQPPCQPDPYCRNWDYSTCSCLDSGTGGCLRMRIARAGGRAQNLGIVSTLLSAALS